MYPPEEFTESAGEIRASLVSYKRNARGGLDLQLTIIEDDKHEAIDLVDGGDFIHLLKVYRMPDE